jgi:MinD-like ATPase involved in chromosome partitioning or flagellar assembly
MERVSMNDGLDGRETVAFGLAASEVAVFVLALMSAYAALRSGLPGAMAWCLAAVLVGGGGALAWGRMAGRPLLEWAVLLARFGVRTRQAHAARLRQRWRGLRPAPGAAESGAVVVRLALRRQGQARGRAGAELGAAPPRLSVVGDVPWRRATAGAPPGAPATRGSRLVAFFSLNGGTGRTSLAVEVAALLAVRGRAASTAGDRGLRVALLDLTERNPAVALRLGIPLPAGLGADAPAGPIVHESGLLVFTASPSALGRDTAAAGVPAALRTAERAGAELVVVDIDCDLGERCLEVLRRCDEVHVTVTPTAGGILDAYRSTAALRRLGLRDRIGYVVNRWREGSDLGEAMDDLGGSIAAEVPEDEAFVEAESRHRLVASGGGAASAALSRLADAVERGIDAGCPAIEPWAGSHAG